MGKRELLTRSRRMPARPRCVPARSRRSRRRRGDGQATEQRQSPGSRATVVRRLRVSIWTNAPVVPSLGGPRRDWSSALRPVARPVSVSISVRLSSRSVTLVSLGRSLQTKAPLVGVAPVSRPKTGKQQAPQASHLPLPRLGRAPRPPQASRRGMDRPQSCGARLPQPWVCSQRRARPGP